MTGRKPAQEPSIPNRIAELREAAGLSRIQLAERVGVNPQTIGYLERGEYNPSLALAFRFADLFAMPLEEVFQRQPGEPEGRDRSGIEAEQRAEAQ
jgi:putative transcriptional regulator